MIKRNHPLIHRVGGNIRSGTLGFNKYGGRSNSCTSMKSYSIFKGKVDRQYFFNP
jgi:hypothetical protein